MATRAIIDVKNDSDDSIVTIYNHWDGYPKGLGKQLIKMLSGMKVVNGLGAEPDKVANGMECLAAQLVAMLKDKPGNIYLYRADATGFGEEYVYTVYLKDGDVYLKCEGRKGFDLNMTEGEEYEVDADETR